MSSKSVMVITAHPDDECLFFSPILLNLIRRGLEVHVLCLSSGDFYGLGTLRAHEFRRSASALGVAPDFAHLVNDSRLSDGPGRYWPPEVVASVVDSFVTTYRIDVVVTFDDGGVSGHPNHCAISAGMRYLLNQRIHSRQSRVSEKPGALPLLHQPPIAPIECMVLETTTFARKYIGLLDLVLSWILDLLLHTHLCDKELASEMLQNRVSGVVPTLVVSGPIDVLTSMFAMLAHRSQLVWYRLLFVLFARYTYFNTLRPISLTEHESGRRRSAFVLSDADCTPLQAQHHTTRIAENNRPKVSRRRTAAI